MNDMKFNWATFGVIVIVALAMVGGVKYGLTATEIGAFGVVATGVASQLAKLVDKHEEDKKS